MKKVLSILLTLALVATFVGCGSSPEPAAPAPAEDTAATEEAAPAEEAAPVEEEAPAEEEAPVEEAAEESYEPVKLNIAYMPNYGSLWSVSTQMALRLLRRWNPAALISVILDREPINCVSTVRHLFLHFPIFLTGML